MTYPYGFVKYVLNIDGGLPGILFSTSTCKLQWPKAALVSGIKAYNAPQ